MMPRRRARAGVALGGAMRRSFGFVLVTVLLLAGCGDAKSRAEKAADAAWEAYMKAAGPREQLAVAREFLSRYPDSEETAGMAGAAVHLLVEPLAAPAEADALLVELLGEARGEKVRRDLLELRLEPLGHLGRRGDLAAVVAEMAALKPLGYSDNTAVAEAARDGGAWELALDHADAALAQSGEDALRSEPAAAKLSDEQVRQRANARRAATLALKGWALANLGRGSEALATFDEADTHDKKLYAGNSDALVGSYRGRTLLRLSRPAEALEALARDALFGNDEEALATMRAAYRATRGGEVGCDDYLWETRLSLARPAADFTLPDYAGKATTFSTLRNGEIALLAFWFPT